MDPIGPLDLPALFEAQRRELLEAAERVLASGAYIQGPWNGEFEERFRLWLDTPGFIVGCANGSDALTLTLQSLPLPPGTRALLPAMTFVATATAVLDAGLDFDLVDVHPKTWVMGPEALPDPAEPTVLVPVHLYGQMAPMDELLPWARQRGGWVVEDAAQAHGARWKGRPVGTWSDGAAFSFYPGKNLGAAGDGGALWVPTEERAILCRELGDYGGRGRHERLGRNSRLDALQAALLCVRLERLTQWNERRRAIAARYRDLLANLETLALPTEPPEAFHVYHQFVVLTPERERLREYLLSKGIRASIHYPWALHQLPPFREKFRDRRYPVAERIAAEGLSLPVGPTLTDAQVDYIAEQVREGLR